MQRNTRRTIIAATGIAALAVAGVAAAASVSVSLTPTGPTPTSATVSAGGTVTFANATPQTVTLASKRAGIPATVLAPNQVFTKVFPAPGSYGYQEDLGGGHQFRATIVVNPEATQGAATLKASKANVAWGTKVTLHGHSPLPGAEVVLQKHQRGSGWSTVALPSPITPAADGTFSVSFTAKSSLSYRLSVAGTGRRPLYSPTTDVHVHAGIRTTVSAHRTKTAHPITVRVFVRPVNASSSVTLQRFNKDRGSWARIAVRRVNPKNGMAIFTWPVLQGATKIRGSLSQKTMHVGIDAVDSPYTIVTGVGKPPEKPKHQHKNDKHHK
jgi:plastocyanin